MARESRKTVLVAVGANTAIATVKGIAGVVSGSSSLLAEAAHSAADAFNQAMLLWSITRSERPPDEEHPFGHGKERFFWTLLAAVMIFLAGAVFSIGQGVLEIVRGEAEQAFWLSLGTLAFAGVAEGASFVRAFRQTLREARDAGEPLIAYVRQSKDPTVKAVLSEDATDLVGLVFAVAGITLAHVTGNTVFDGAGAILIGLVLVVVAWLLGLDTKGLLLGEAAPKRERERLREVIERHRGIDSVAELLTMYIGPESLLVAARVHLADDLRAREIEELAERIEAELKEAVPTVDQVFLDPTARRSR